MPQALVCGVHVLAEADRIKVALRATCSDQNYITGWHVIGFYKPAVPICALYFQPIVLRGRYGSDHMFYGHECWLYRRGYEVPLWR